MAIKVETHIAAPPERVFALASDFANMPSRIKGISKVEMLTPGKIGVGTKFKETRMMFGKEATETMEVTAFDPPNSYDLGCFSCGTRYHSTLRCEPDGAGTKVTLSMTVKGESLFAKLMMPIAWLFSGMMKKCFAADLESIKSAAEQGK